LKTRCFIKNKFGKIHELEKTRRNLATELEEYKMQMEELEDSLKLSEEAKLRLEVKLQATKTDTDKLLQAKEAEMDEKRKSYLKQVCLFLFCLDTY